MTTATRIRYCSFVTALLLIAMPAHANLIIEESQVPPYDLPDILHPPDGPPITTAHGWESLTRPALLASFETHVYGQTPRVPVWLALNDSADDISHAPPTDAIRLTVENESTREIFGGKAILRQARLRFRHGDRTAAFDVLVALPARSSRPVPAIVALNFWGNHTIDAEPSIQTPDPVPGMEQKERGSYSRRWNLEQLIDRGYAVATAFRGEIVPESSAHFSEGILAIFPENTGDTRMGAIGAWAWSLSRIADYLAAIPEIDSSRLIVAGHSRLGKAALWAAAQDTRFSTVFANDTGCMGAALSRRRFGETVEIIARNFPYWFSPRLPAYAAREDKLPVDQHQLLALIAPRPLHLGTASEDLWADPYGELLALREAAKIYALYGIDADLPEQLPTPDAIPVGTVLRFHQREGKHDLLPADWDAYLSAAAHPGTPCFNSASEP